MKNKINKVISDNLIVDFSNKSLQQRGYADIIENECNKILTKNFDNVIEAKSRRSIEDIQVENCYIDHKSCDISLDFKMPNLISIDRLLKLNKPLYYNFIIYSSKDKKLVNNFCLNVFELNWKYLAIQNLGKGQLQISNMKEFLENPTINITKEEWLAVLKTKAISFYEKLIIKTNKNIELWKLI